MCNISTGADARVASGAVSLRFEGLLTELEFVLIHRDWYGLHVTYLILHCDCVLDRVIQCDGAGDLILVLKANFLQGYRGLDCGIQCNGARNCDPMEGCAGVCNYAGQCGELGNCTCDAAYRCVPLSVSVSQSLSLSICVSMFEP